MRYRFTIILSLLFFTSQIFAYVPAGEFTKNIQKEFSIASNGLVHITNKYGKVDISSWTQNKVQINVLIKVDAASENKADDVFEKIHIEFENSEDLVKAWTNLEDMSSSSWFWGKSKKYKFTIDYEVKAPANSELYANNKYGNIHIGNFNNDVEVDLKYGDLTMGEVDGDVKTVIKYGNAQFQDLGNLVLDCGYSNLKGMEAGDLDVTSKYSKVSFDKVGDVQINSKYDEFNIVELGDFRNAGKYDSFSLGKVRTIELSSQYTNLTAEEVLVKAQIDVDYGAVKLKNVSPACSGLDLQGKHSSYKLYMGGNYRLDLDTKYTSVNLPDNFTTETQKKESNELYIKGFSGSRNADTKVVVEMKYGSFSIKQ